MLVLVMMIVRVLVHAELRGRHAGAQHAVGVNVRIAERKSPEGALQLVERQTGIEERAERHVAGDAGETIEIENAAHSCWDSLKLQYRTSPRMM